MADKTNGLAFDPGFAPLLLVFQGTVEYLYSDINRFKNLSQKKVKFMQYYKKILEVFYNNTGFYVGCLMWAVYLKAQSKQEILSNHCFGGKYNEEENISDTQFMLRFTELFPKDVKYFLGQNFEFEQKFVDIIKIYEGFLVLNKGFTETKLNSDIKLPDSINLKDADLYKSFIDKALEEGNLSLLNENIEKLLKK